jgi:hypothetical protein
VSISCVTFLTQHNACHQSLYGTKSNVDYPGAGTKQPPSCTPLIKLNATYSLTKESYNPPTMPIETHFDIPFISSLALREKQIQQNNRPIINFPMW